MLSTELSSSSSSINNENSNDQNQSNLETSSISDAVSNTNDSIIDASTDLQASDQDAYSDHIPHRLELESSKDSKENDNAHEKVDNDLVLNTESDPNVSIIVPSGTTGSIPSNSDFIHREKNRVLFGQSLSNGSIPVGAHYASYPSELPDVFFQHNQLIFKSIVPGVMASDLEAIQAGFFVWFQVNSLPRVNQCIMDFKNVLREASCESIILSLPNPKDY